MTDKELEAIARGLSPVVRDIVARATEPLLRRLEALEHRAPVPGRDGRDGVPGPPGERGLEGPQGLRGEMGPVGPVGPPGEVGPIGMRGETGEVGPKGERGEVGPVGPMGLPGPKGEKGDPGEAGAVGPSGPPGERGEVGPAGPQGEKGADGVNGKDGKDGVVFSAADLIGHHFDGQRTLTLTFGRDGHSVDVPMRLSGLPVYREVWKDGTSYEAGDVVTWNGGMWIALEDTTAKPNLPTAASRAWKLCVMRGAEGKRGEKGAKGDPGDRGPQGERGPERW